MSNVAAVAPSNLNWDAQRTRLAQHGQEHLLQFVDQLAPAEQKELYDELSELNVSDVHRCFTRAQETQADSAEKKDDRVKPLDSAICGSVDNDSDRVGVWQKKGLEKISKGEIAVLLLAGETMLILVELPLLFLTSRWSGN